MASVTAPNTAALNPLSHSKQFLEDGDKLNNETIEQMSNAIQNSENLDQFLNHIAKQKNCSQTSEELATAAASPNKAGLSVETKPYTSTFNMRFFDPFQYLNSSDEEECTFHPQINKNAARLAKREFACDTNEMLYRYASERTEKKLNFTQINEQDLFRQTTVNLSDKNSVRMVLKKLQNALSTLVKDAEDGEQDNHITFEGLGTILHRLGVFQNLEFNNGNNDGEKSSLSINYAKVKPERLTKEINFHENFWKICSLPSLVNNYASSELVTKILTVLVEEKTAVAEAGNFLTELLNSSLQAISLRGEQDKSAFEVQKDEKSLWNLSKIVSEFRQLFDNKTQFMTVYNAKKTLLNTEELKNRPNFTCTHSPQVNKKSAKIDSRQWKSKFNSRLETTHANLTQKDIQTRNNRLYKYSKYLENKKNSRIESRIVEELSPCTFVPKTKAYKKTNNLGSVRNNETHNDSLSPSRLGYFSQALAENSGANRHLLLYEVAKTYKEKLQQKTYAYKKKEECQEMAECTFSPEVNRDFASSAVSTQDFYEGVPRGFKKNVERLHLGGYIRESKQAELENIPRGENYQKNREADFTPPTFLQRPKIKKDEVLVYVDVSIGPGKTGRIGIHKGDNAKALALNFSRTYSLNATMKESLEKLLQSYIDSYFSQPAAQQEAENNEQANEVEEGEEGNEGENNEEDEGEDEGEEEEEDDEEEGEQDN